MESAAIEKAKTIVIFFALHANLPAYQNLLEGFSTTFWEKFGVKSVPEIIHIAYQAGLISTNKTYK